MSLCRVVASIALMVATVSIVGCAPFARQIIRNPQIAIAFHIGRASSEFRDGKYSDAIADYTAAIQLEPSNRFLYERRGYVYLYSRDYRSATRDFDAAWHMTPLMRQTTGERAQLLHFRGFARSESGDFPGAVADFTDAIEHYPANPLAYIDRAGAYYRHGDFKEAVNDATAALATEPYLNDALEARADAYAGERDWRDAISDESTIISKNTMNAVALNDRCWYRTIAGVDLRSALADCGTALSTPIHSTLRADTLSSRAFTYLKLGNPKAAVADCNASLALSPRLADSLFLRSVAEMRLGNRMRARNDEAAALAIKPEVRSEYAGYGLTLNTSASSTATRG